MQNCKPFVAPIIKEDKFSKDQSPQNALEQEQMKDILYASTIGSLMYAQVYTRPDICLAIGILGRFQRNPDVLHWVAAKKVMRYLQGTKNYRLTFRHTDMLDVVGYSDSDFAGCVDSRKSTSGYILLLAGGTISWRSTKQTIIATSTMEAEFIACYETTTHALCLKNFISGLKVVNSIERPIRIDCENSATVFFSKNNKNGNRSKHIDIKYLSMRENIKSSMVSIHHTTADLMIADSMTKG
ncbi:secreted RxLR effector protein 161-like [Phoenix dactylifera]|uniref:Secreted RxLR effector protein 161-like n=1 Tax=Phoenix dactylifera TaxID=42345 RepID=A0A8B8ZFC8_PHODC|nr:secreted RxLR effector protein 161-like [Phoenix dactylifera]